MLDKIKSWLKGKADDERALSGLAIELTVFLIIVGFVLAPIGLTAIAGVNTTAAGVSSGTNKTIWDAIVPLGLAALILGVIYYVKKQGR